MLEALYSNGRAGMTDLPGDEIGIKHVCTSAERENSSASHVVTNLIWLVAKSKAKLSDWSDHTSFSMTVICDHSLQCTLLHSICT